MEYIKYSEHQIHLILQELINSYIILRTSPDPGVIQPNIHTILPTQYLKRSLIAVHTKTINEQRFYVNSCQRQGRFLDFFSA